jgi:hypothetical protein
MARLAVVIPVYQAEATLTELTGELLPILSSITPDFEVWLVDDGSTDGSWGEIQRVAASEGRIRGLRLIRNFGEHVAITAGLDRVDADHAIIMACDLQDDPAAIPRMLEASERGADLVLVRRMKRRDGWLKRLLARMFYALISLLFNVHYDYRVGNFRLLTRRAVDYFRQHRERMRNVNAIMALMGVDTAYVDVTHRARRHGRSTWAASSAGRAPRSQRGGREFEPPAVHQRDHQRARNEDGRHVRVPHTDRSRNLVADEVDGHRADARHRDPARPAERQEGGGGDRRLACDDVAIRGNHRAGRDAASGDLGHHRTVEPRILSWLMSPGPGGPPGTSW